MLNRVKSHLEELRSRVRQNPRLIAPLVIVLIVLIGGGYYFLRTVFGGNELIFSGTIEAVEIHLGTEIGGRVEYVGVEEGEQVKVNQSLVELRRLNAGMERVRSPIDGVVMERLVEPGEVVSPGGTLLILGNLDELTLTVYVPEDKYGQITLGQVCWVMVDSFPGEMFVGRVSHIADRAEFTPRNVQTVEGRKTTVFAVRLDVEPAGGRLKPGMPADVNCFLK